MLTAATLSTLSFPTDALLSLIFHHPDTLSLTSPLTCLAYCQDSSFFFQFPPSLSKKKICIKEIEERKGNRCDSWGKIPCMDTPSLARGVGNDGCAQPLSHHPTHHPIHRVDLTRDSSAFILNRLHERSFSKFCVNKAKFKLAAPTEVTGNCTSVAFFNF